MRTPLASPLRAVGLAALLCLCSNLLANVERSEQLLFDIEFDGKAMGRHEFQLTYDSANRVRVESRVEMRYRVAFITLFRYQHSASEQWRDGCLQTLSSTTNDDGERFEVEATAQASGFLVRHRRPVVATERIEDTCPATFAYWQPALLQRPALINAQTGRLQAVRVERQGQTLLDEQPAEHWTIETEGEGTIELWYASADGRWLQLQHTTADGTLVYRRADS